jgi:rare lipoprotein A
MLLALWLACAHKPVESGLASWYGDELRGRPTASGEPFRPSKRTAAHKTLPFGTVVRVTYLETGDRVRVVINDRGPFVRGRVIDLSKKAARRVGLIDAGVGPVELRVVGCKRRYGGC